MSREADQRMEENHGRRRELQDAEYQIGKNVFVYKKLLSQLSHARHGYRHFLADFLFLV